MINSKIIEHRIVKQLITNPLRTRLFRFNSYKQIFLRSERSPSTILLDLQFDRLPIQEGRSGKTKGYQVEQFLVQYEETKNEKV